MIYFRRFPVLYLDVIPDVLPAATYFDTVDVFAIFRRYSRFSDAFRSFFDILNVCQFYTLFLILDVILVFLDVILVHFRFRCYSFRRYSRWTFRRYSLDVIPVSLDF